MSIIERCTDAVDSEMLVKCLREKSTIPEEGLNGESMPEGMHRVGR